MENMGQDMEIFTPFIVFVKECHLTREWQGLSAIFSPTNMENVWRWEVVGVAPACLANNICWSGQYCCKDLSSTSQYWCKYQLIGLPYLNRESLIRGADTLNLHVLYCFTVAESLGLAKIILDLRTVNQVNTSITLSWELMLMLSNFSSCGRLWITVCLYL